MNARACDRWQLAWTWTVRCTRRGSYSWACGIAGDCSHARRKCTGGWGQSSLGHLGSQTHSGSARSEHDRCNHGQGICGTAGGVRGTLRDDEVRGRVESGGGLNIGSDKIRGDAISECRD